MTLFIPAVIAFLGAAVTALTVSIVLNDWIWLSIYMAVVPSTIATIAALRVGPGSYPAIALVTVLGSAFALSWVEAASGYMEMAGWYLFIATFPVTVVIGITAALFVGLAHRRTSPAT